jgi:hypothetical protein
MLETGIEVETKDDEDNEDELIQKQAGRGNLDTYRRAKLLCQACAKPLWA